MTIEHKVPRNERFCIAGREMESALFRDAFAHAAMRRRCAEELRRLSAAAVLVDRKPLDLRGGVA